MELFGTHWPPGTANKTRMMRTKGWIPSLQQRCHHQTSNTTATCICSAVTTTPRSWRHLTALLSPSQMAYAQDTAISLGTCHHCSTVTCSAHLSPCLVLVNIRTHKICPTTHHIILQHTLQHTRRARPSVLLLTQATHALPLSSKHTAIIHQMPDNIHQQGQGLCNLHLSAHTRKMTFCTNGTMALNHRSAPHNQATKLSHPSNM